VFFVFFLFTFPNKTRSVTGKQIYFTKIIKNERLVRIKNSLQWQNTKKKYKKKIKK